jgi:hypothetical protein
MKNYLRNLISGFSPREQRLVLIASAVFVLLVAFICWYLIRNAVDELEGKDRRYSELLSLIDAKKQAFIDREKESKIGLGNVKPTPLRTLVDKIGKQLEVTVPDVKELPEQRHNTMWVENSVELSMREIGLVSLTEFMEEVKGNARRFPIAITKLSIRKRKRKDDTFDVKMTISTYEKTEDALGLGKKRKSRKGGVK